MLIAPLIPKNSQRAAQLRLPYTTARSPLRPTANSKTLRTFSMALTRNIAAIGNTQLLRTIQKELSNEKPKVTLAPKIGPRSALPIQPKRLQLYFEAISVKQIGQRHCFQIKNIKPTRNSAAKLHPQQTSWKRKNARSLTSLLDQTVQEVICRSYTQNLLSRSGLSRRPSGGQKASTASPPGPSDLLLKLTETYLNGSGNYKVSLSRLGVFSRKAESRRRSTVKRPIRIKTNALIFAIASILSQPDNEGYYYPIAF